MPKLRLSILAAACSALLVPAPSPAAQGTDCVGADDPVTTTNIRASERALLCLVNVYRSANGAGLLTDDAALDRAARKHSEYMERTNQFDHQGIGDGTPSSRAQAEGFPCDWECVGENIAYSGFPGYTAREMFTLWQHSPGHNANMLEPTYITGGMGFALGGNHGLTGTQNFSGVDGGGTDTAEDLLTDAACEAATARETEAARKVAKAKKRVKKAEGERKRKAKRKLRDARADARTATAEADVACDLEY